MASTKARPLDEALLTPEQVAERVNASVRQVRRWMIERRLGFVDLPRGRRIPASALASFLAARTVDPDDEAAR